LDPAGVSGSPRLASSGTRLWILRAGVVRYPGSGIDGASSRYGRYDVDQSHHHAQDEGEPEAPMVWTNRRGSGNSSRQQETQGGEHEAGRAEQTANQRACANG
jgi:hypothetical protein